MSPNNKKFGFHALFNDHWGGDKYRKPYPHNQRGCFQDLNPWPPSQKAATLLLRQGSPSMAMFIIIYKIFLDQFHIQACTWYLKFKMTAQNFHLKLCEERSSRKKFKNHELKSAQQLTRLCDDIFLWLQHYLCRKNQMKNDITVIETI